MGGGPDTPTSIKYDPRELFKNVKKLFQEGHFHAFARVWRAWSTSRVLGTLLESSYQVCKNKPRQFHLRFREEKQNRTVVNVNLPLPAKCYENRIGEDDFLTHFKAYSRKFRIPS